MDEMMLMISDSHSEKHSEIERMLQALFQNIVFDLLSQHHDANVTSKVTD